MFTTYDSDHDPSAYSCGVYYSCGWWFNDCFVFLFIALLYFYLLLYYIIISIVCQFEWRLRFSRLRVWNSFHYLEDNGRVNVTSNNENSMITNSSEQKKIKN